MAYRFEDGRTVPENIRSIARQQIDRAIVEINDRSLDRHRIVHQVRKRCKKLRGLVRLVRCAFDGYEAENAFFRDAARPLSGVRDAHSLLECFDGLMRRFWELVDPRAMAPMREVLVERRQEIAEHELADDFDNLLDSMHTARRRVAGWQLDAEGFDALAGGLDKSYRRARKGLRVAYRDPRPEAFHEWRKRVKYHWYHNRLLRPIWPGMMRVQIAATDHLSDLLGDEHDLAVFRQVLLAEHDRFGGHTDPRGVVGLCDRRRLELQARAQPLGERVFAEKPQRLVARYARYWDIWRAAGK